MANLKRQAAGQSSESERATSGNGLVGRTTVSVHLRETLSRTGTPPASEDVCAQLRSVAGVVEVEHTMNGSDVGRFAVVHDANVDVRVALYRLAVGRGWLLVELAGEGPRWDACEETRELDELAHEVFTLLEGTGLAITKFPFKLSDSTLFRVKRLEGDGRLKWSRLNRLLTEALSPDFEKELEERHGRMVHAFKAMREDLDDIKKRFDDFPVPSKETKEVPMDPSFLDELNARLSDPAIPSQMRASELAASYFVHWEVLRRSGYYSEIVDGPSCDLVLQPTLKHLARAGQRDEEEIEIHEEMALHGFFLTRWYPLGYFPLPPRHEIIEAAVGMLPRLSRAPMSALVPHACSSALEEVMTFVFRERKVDKARLESLGRSVRSMSIATGVRCARAVEIASRR